MKTHICMLLVALLTTGSLMAARPNRYAQQNGYRAKVTQTARGGQRQMPQTASKTAPLTGIEAFVEKHLATAKRFRDFDAEKAPAAFAKVQTAPNYDAIPPQYRALIEANQDKCTLGAGSTIPYWGQDFKLQFYKNRIVVYHFKLDASNLMATFEPARDAKPFFTIPDKVLKTMSPEDQAYAQTLRDVVNENVAFLWDVPFFVPDMDLFRKNEYGGKFIPEKYLITGEKLDLVPAHLVDENKKDMQRRWGFPIYDVSQVETGKIDDPSGCFFHSDYKRMTVVDRLKLLNFDAVDNERKSLLYLRKIQYERAQTGLATLTDAMTNEESYLKENGQWTPNKGKILSVLKKQLDKIIPPAEKTLTETIQNKQFIYTLRQPNGKPRFIRQTDVTKPAPTTAGTIPN